MVQIFVSLKALLIVNLNFINFFPPQVAYFRGPEYFHASYSIIVKRVENDSDYESLSSFAGLVRVNENVSKVNDKSLLKIKITSNFFFYKNRS